MVLTEFIKKTMDFCYQDIVQSVEGLTHEELCWRPKRECNSIGFLVWHMSRALDGWIQSRVRKVPQIWEEWATKMNLSQARSYSGFGLTADDLDLFVVPPKKLLLQYARESWNSAINYLDTIDDEKLYQVKINHSRLGGQISMATLYHHLISEVYQHAGQIAYIRGIGRGIEGIQDKGEILTSEIK